MSETDEQQYGVSRLVSFSDGVFGFAITLLITTIPFSFEGLASSASDAQIVPHLLAFVTEYRVRLTRYGAPHQVGEKPV